MRDSVRAYVRASVYVCVCVRACKCACVCVRACVCAYPCTLFIHAKLHYVSATPTPCVLLSTSAPQRAATLFRSSRTKSRDELAHDVTKTLKGVRQKSAHIKESGGTRSPCQQKDYWLRFLLINTSSVTTPRWLQGGDEGGEEEREEGGGKEWGVGGGEGRGEERVEVCLYLQFIKNPSANRTLLPSPPPPLRAPSAYHPPTTHLHRHHPPALYWTISLQASYPRAHNSR